MALERKFFNSSTVLPVGLMDMNWRMVSDQVSIRSSRKDMIDLALLLFWNVASTLAKERTGVKLV